MPPFAYARNIAHVLFMLNAVVSAISVKYSSLSTNEDADCVKHKNLYYLTLVMGLLSGITFFALEMESLAVLVDLLMATTCLVLFYTKTKQCLKQDGKADGVFKASIISQGVVAALVAALGIGAII